MSLAKEHLEKKAKKSAESKENVKINIKKTYKVKFTEDFGFNKKGIVTNVSETAYEIYKEAGVIESV